MQPAILSEIASFLFMVSFFLSKRVMYYVYQGSAVRHSIVISFRGMSISTNLTPLNSSEWRDQVDSHSWFTIASIWKKLSDSFLLSQALNECITPAY